MKEPLPPVVSVDASTKVKSAIQVSAATGNPTNPGIATSVSSIQSQTGKKVVLVALIHAANDSRDALEWRWMGVVIGQSPHYFSSQAAGVDWAQSFVASQAVPTGWTVIS